MISGYWALDAGGLTSNPDYFSSDFSILAAPSLAL
jgi:hypothetical protein